MLRNGVFVLFLLVFVGILFSATPSTSTSGTTPSAITNPPMNMAVNDALPAKFRGGNTDQGTVHVLEDGNYKIQEHSVLYQDDASTLPGSTSGSQYKGAPTINWNTEKENADGTLAALGNQNTNQATNDSNFADPGTYRIHNNGSREVSGGSSDTSGSDSGAAFSTTGSGGGATSGTGAAATAGTGAAASTGTGAAATAGTGAAASTGTGAAATAGTGAAASTGTGAAASQRVNTNQTLTVISHDCTSPNLWAVFQEGAGSTNLADCEATLKEELKKQMLEASGTFDPGTDLKGSLKDASLMALFECPKNAKPKSKTSMVALKGALFDKDGKMIVSPSGLVKMAVLNEEDQTRVVEVTKDTVPGVYVRRNIPFLVAAQMTDNGTYNRDGAECWIEKANGDKVDKTDNAYLFRVPNYPRDNYTDQPDYVFVVQGQDEAGNVSKIHVPLYVVNTKTSLEGGKTE
ncbi:MAG: hypothetical protein HQM08_04170 [Candidatus Riflebacteria bacterium]|nr:hypothetical protein [Candidatus Riflebacteria bacterium]